MKRILVTGATGNVGREVVQALQHLGGVIIRAGVRHVALHEATWRAWPQVQPVVFDFCDAATHAAALAGCDGLFLLRPPELTDAFGDLIARARRAGVGHIVFLSVQGAEDNRFIPHHKTEQLLRASGVPYTLLRPAYFMQNFITTLRADLVARHRIFLPAGRARSALVDVRDVGSVAAVVLAEPGAQHHGQAYTLTAQHRLTFQQMAEQLTAGLGVPIAYESPTPWTFYRAKRREGLAPGFILVMLLLHYLPRFLAEPPVTSTIAELLGRPPIEFEQFVADNRSALGTGTENNTKPGQPSQTG